MAFWSKWELLARDLSASNVLPSGELKERLFDAYELMGEIGSEFYLTKENRATGCGSCIKRVRQQVMRHFHKYEFKDNGRLAVRVFDGKRPIYYKL